MRHTFLFLAAASCLLVGQSTAQTPAANSPDPGVTPVRLMDRAEIRISRVEVQPGAVRSVHTHDDVRFHVWVALSGKLEITIGAAQPVAAKEGQAFFMQKGTPHGFRNTGPTGAAVMEIFVKEGAGTGDLEAMAAALAAAAK